MANLTYDHPRYHGLGRYEEQGDLGRRKSLPTSAALGEGSRNYRSYQGGRGVDGTVAQTPDEVRGSRWCRSYQGGRGLYDD